MADQRASFTAAGILPAMSTRTSGVTWREAVGAGHDQQQQQQQQQQPQQ